MRPLTLRLERLLGTMVVDDQQRRLGRIEEIIAERRGEECIVTEYLLGSMGLLKRLAVSGLFTAAFERLGIRPPEPVRIPGSALDLSDLEHPRLRLPSGERAPKRGGH